MAAASIIHGDCIDEMRAMPDASIGAIVTDPPYGLGFMGRKWDALPPGEDWARECLRVLKPGGHLLAFGGSRTWHRLAVAVEDAGFEIRDSIAWLYGSGFPKSLDVSKAIDKAGGNPLAFRRFARAYAAAVAASPFTHADIDRRLGIKSSSCYWAREDRRGGMPPRHHWEAVRDLLGLSGDHASLYDAAEREVVALRGRGFTPGGNSVYGDFSGDNRVTAPATPDAERWQGWGTALKPAFEPLVVARKPLAGTVAANVLEHGTGALNIDGCRIGYQSQADMDQARVPQPVQHNDAHAVYQMGTGSGRNGEVFDPSKGRWPANVILDESQAAALDQQSGTTTATAPATLRRGATTGRSIGGESAYGTAAPAEAVVGYGDTGGASRFFYVAKAPKKERPVVGGIAHPTVKPLTLMRHLVRLVTPPGGTVLDTFAGSGATVEAALLEGFDVVGIEREADYLPLIKARVARVTEKEDAE